MHMYNQYMLIKHFERRSWGLKACQWVQNHFNAHHNQESCPHARHYLCALSLISSPYQYSVMKVQFKYPQTKLTAMPFLWYNLLCFLQPTVYKSSREKFRL